MCTAAATQAPNSPQTDETGAPGSRRRTYSPSVTCTNSRGANFIVTEFPKSSPPFPSPHPRRIPRSGHGPLRGPFPGSRVAGVQLHPSSGVHAVQDSGCLRPMQPPLWREVALPEGRGPRSLCPVSCWASGRAGRQCPLRSGSRRGVPGADALALPEGGDGGWLGGRGGQAAAPSLQAQAGPGVRGIKESQAVRPSPGCHLRALSLSCSLPSQPGPRFLLLGPGAGLTPPGRVRSPRQTDRRERTVSQRPFLPGPVAWQPWGHPASRLEPMKTPGWAPASCWDLETQTTPAEDGREASQGGTLAGVEGGKG